MKFYKIDPWAVPDDGSTAPKPHASRWFPTKTYLAKVWLENVFKECKFYKIFSFVMY
jgi:hypothetical protein